MELKKYVLTDNNIIYLTEKINSRIITMDDKIGFWALKANKIFFATIVKTGDNYKQMRNKNE